MRAKEAESQKSWTKQALATVSRQFSSADLLRNLRAGEWILLFQQGKKAIKILFDDLDKTERQYREEHGQAWSVQTARCVRMGQSAGLIFVHFPLYFAELQMLTGCTISHCACFGGHFGHTSASSMAQ